MRKKLLRRQPVGMSGPFRKFIQDVTGRAVGPSPIMQYQERKFPRPIRDVVKGIIGEEALAKRTVIKTLLEGIIK